MANKEDTRQPWRYSKELPADRADLARAWKLLEDYSGIPPAEIEGHVRTVRDKAFAIFHYPCIGRWRFLQLYLPDSPLYPTIISRLKSGESFLDVGCCFGQILRQLAFDGVPMDRLAGTDLRPEFVDLGYELFQDRDKFKALFVTGDILNPADQSLKALDDQFNIIHAASFFHLFGWDDQLVAGERIVHFLKPGMRQHALIVGRQVGDKQPLSVEEYRSRRAAGTLERDRYLHNVETFQKLWDEIGSRTGTKWTVTGDLLDIELDDTYRVIFRYAVAGV